MGLAAHRPEGLSLKGAHAALQMLAGYQPGCASRLACAPFRLNAAPACRCPGS